MYFILFLDFVPPSTIKPNIAITESIEIDDDYQELLNQIVLPLTSVFLTVIVGVFLIFMKRLVSKGEDEKGEGIDSLEGSYGGPLAVEMELDRRVEEAKALQQAQERNQPAVQKEDKKTKKGFKKSKRGMKSSTVADDAVPLSKIVVQMHSEVTKDPEDEEKVVSEDTIQLGNSFGRRTQSNHEKGKVVHNVPETKKSHSFTGFPYAEDASAEDAEEFFPQSYDGATHIKTPNIMVVAHTPLKPGTPQRDDSPQRAGSPLKAGRSVGRGRGRGITAKSSTKSPDKSSLSRSPSPRSPKAHSPLSGRMKKIIKKKKLHPKPKPKKG